MGKVVEEGTSIDITVEEETKDEAYWAMKYAKASKNFVELEHRYFALMFHSVPFVIAVNALMDAVSNKDTEQTVENFREVLEIGINLEMTLHQYIIDPVKRSWISKKEINNLSSVLGFEGDTMKRIYKIIKGSVEKDDKGWDKLTETFTNMPSAGQVRQGRQNQIEASLEAIMKVVEKINENEVKNLFNKGLTGNLH